MNWRMSVIGNGIKMNLKNKIEYIYTIVCEKNKNFYIGYTVEPNTRRATHFNSLLANSHSSKQMQKDYNVHGLKHFKFEILFSGQNLLEKEKLLIHTLKPVYNNSKYETPCLFTEISILNKKIELLTLTLGQCQPYNSFKETQLKDKKYYKELIIKKYGTISNFAKEIDMSQGSLSRTLLSNSALRLKTKKLFDDYLK